MRKKIVRIGSSAGITVSPGELAAMGLAVGDQVEVTVRAGVLEVTPVDKYAGMPLAELRHLVNERLGVA